MPPRSTKFVLPPDHTFTPNGIPMHIDTYERLEKLLDQASKRNPDAFDMHIYNDYFGYAILDLIDGTLSTIHTHITKKRWLDAWHALTALAIFCDAIDDWINADDGDRIVAMEQARGALTVKTIRALDSEGLLNEKVIPNLASTLGTMVGFGDTWADTLDICYHLVLKGYGKKLFGARTDAEWKRIRDAQEKAFEVFVTKLSPKEREARRQMAASDDEEEDSGDSQGEENEKAWFEDGNIEDINTRDPSLRITATWKGYKAHVEHPRSYFDRFEWDLTKWSEADKKPYRLRGGAKVTR